MDGMGHTHQGMHPHREASTKERKKTGVKEKKVRVAFNLISLRFEVQTNKG